MVKGKIQFEKLYFNFYSESSDIYYVVRIQYMNAWYAIRKRGNFTFSDTIMSCST